MPPHPHDAPPTDPVTRVRALIVDLFERILGREENERTPERGPDEQQRSTDEKQFVGAGVDSLPNSWRDL